MRTAGVLAATGLLLLLGMGACSSDDTPAAATAPDGGGATPDSGKGGTDAAEGGSTNPGDPKRGSRLAPRFRETADGYSEFFGMIDTGLGNHSCRALVAEDAVTRCLPDDAPYLGTAAVVYSDMNCGTELAITEANCAKPMFAMRIADSSVNSCNTGTLVFDIGAQHTTQIYKWQDPTTCVPVDSDPKSSYWTVGAKRAPTDFVKLTQRTETIAGGIGLSMHDGDDGSTYPRSDLVDVARARACREAKTTDGKTRCIPSAAGSVDGFIENMCTKPAAQVSPYDCDPLFVAITANLSTPANDGTAQVFELGAKQPTKEIFRQVDSMCDGPFAGGTDVYERGPEIAPVMFPELGFATATGTRIVTKHYSAAGTTLLPTRIETRDTMLDVPCFFTPATDGKERCLPQGAYRMYSDDKCTVPVVDLAEAPPKYAFGFGDGCPRPFIVFTVGAEIPVKPAKLYVNTGGPCVESGQPGPSDTIYAVGAEVPPSTFVEATRVTK